MPGVNLAPLDFSINFDSDAFSGTRENACSKNAIVIACAACGESRSWADRVFVCHGRDAVMLFVLLTTT